MEVWFVAVETFGPGDGGWHKYIEWSRLSQLTRVIGLDDSLCPSVIREPSDQDWRHLVTGDFLGVKYFRDRDYLVARTKAIKNKEVLAVVLEPDAEQRWRPVPDGQFLGYELLERRGTTSALTNCQGFPGSFDNRELNQYGLISDYDRAKQVQRRLLEENPGEPHADTDLWAIWRLHDDA
jgi:hypothetical protein